MQCRICMKCVAIFRIPLVNYEWKELIFQIFPRNAWKWLPYSRICIRCFAYQKKIWLLIYVPTYVYIHMYVYIKLVTYIEHFSYLIFHLFNSEKFLKNAWFLKPISHLCEQDIYCGYNLQVNRTTFNYSVGNFNCVW